VSAEQLELSWGSQPRIMGILNATPDSFSGDGLDDAVDALVGRGQAQARAGAAILDIGGESTRPGATPVPAAEERRRVLPVIERLAREVDVPISIDTSKAEVAAAALEAGARIVNDVSGLIDPRLAPTAAKYGAWLVLTHNGWTLGYAPPPERDLVDEVVGVLERLADQALKAGVPEDRVIVDPGLGFGKPAADSCDVCPNCTRASRHFRSLSGLRGRVSSDSRSTSRWRSGSKARWRVLPRPCLPEPRSYVSTMCSRLCAQPGWLGRSGAA
jgi:dihydropteroate synthase